VKEIKKLNCHNIVFTGGEPTLFSKDIQEIQDKL
jgi:organic radical activating enzyme